jgi:ABC-type nitrate/sulfonate/bicarbonate transport system substrate-binding protein
MDWFRPAGVKVLFRAAPLLAFFLVAPPAVSAAAEADYAAAYPYDLGEAAVDVGAQPLGYPSGMFSAAMARDRILAAALAEAGLELRVHAYLKGFDIIPYLDGKRVEAALLGDMPTILAAASGDVAIVGLVKQTFSSVVAHNAGQMSELKGKRVGFALGSSAHHALLRGLRSAGLSERDVTLVPIGVEAMPEALHRGRIDAFAAWEPAPTLALRQDENAQVVYRGVSTDYFVLSRDFVRRQPEAAREVVAAFVRALNWMGSSHEALLRTCEWTLADGQSFTGKEQKTSPEQAAAIVRREILDIASAPVIPRRAVDGKELLESEFGFLRELGKIPEGITWQRVRDSFARQLLIEILAKPGRYRLDQFDYAAAP